jgi:hypothetical protein
MQLQITEPRPESKAIKNMSLGLQETDLGMPTFETDNFQTISWRHNISFLCFNAVKVNHLQVELSKNVSHKQARKQRGTGTHEKQRDERA